MELSARKKANCHILGYDFRNGDTELFRLCEKFRLREKGVDIDLSEVEKIAGGEVIAPTPFRSGVGAGGCVHQSKPLTVTWTRRNFGGG